MVTKLQLKTLINYEILQYRLQTWTRQQQAVNVAVISKSTTDDCISIDKIFLGQICQIVKDTVQQEGSGRN
jgi:hypothetical protein